MADKQRIKYLEEHIPMIETRIRTGKWMFGDHRRLKEMKAELAFIKVKQYGYRKDETHQSFFPGYSTRRCNQFVKCNYNA